MRNTGFFEFLFIIGLVLLIGGTILTAGITAPTLLFVGGHWIAGIALSVCEALTGIVALVALYAISQN